ncbi:hypothetical protein [Streptomyces sp. NPDC015130]|uniref:hypothetical protein n=1 Tax=Streptomyces sp. NPDC015130 TaxID=3364940 RepID=UPI0036FE6E31
MPGRLPGGSAGGPRFSDLAHFLVSVLYPYDQAGKSWADRRVDLRACLEREPADEAEAWALERLRAFLDQAPLPF